MNNDQQKTSSRNGTDESDLILGTSLWEDAWKRLRKNNMALASGVILLCLAVLCLLGPVLLGVFMDMTHTRRT